LGLTVLAVSSECAVNQPQRPPSQHDSVTVWQFGHSRCARTNMGASVLPQYLQRSGSRTTSAVWHLGHSRCSRTDIGASVVPQCLQRGDSTLAELSSVNLSVCTQQWDPTASSPSSGHKKWRGV